MQFAGHGTALRRRPELGTVHVTGLAVLALGVLLGSAGKFLERRATDSVLDASSGAAADVRPLPPRSDVGDLEPLVIEVEAAGAAYKVGSVRISSAVELTNLLRKFVGKADGAFVRVSDDAPISLAAGAFQACQDAGLSPVSYVAAAPGD